MLDIHEACVTTQPSNSPELIDPLKKLSEIFAVQDITVDDLVDALQLTSEEVQLNTGDECWSTKQFTVVLCTLVESYFQ